MAGKPDRPDPSTDSRKQQNAHSSRPRGPSSSETNRGSAADSVPLAGKSSSGSVPKTLGRYKLLRELGRGQMGAVYLAQDTELDRFVALKLARSSSSGSAKLLKRMEIEAKSAAKVDHPLICKVYDAGEIDGIRFIALQYVEGEDLKKYLAREGRCRDPKEAVGLVVKLLEALSAAHDKNVIHRDLKPENVMLNKNGDPVIMDFGLARHAVGSSDAGLTQGMVVGTAAYMSPEQATGKTAEIDQRSDLYAVGVMLFEMLTGEWPFTGGAVEVMGKKCVLQPPAPQSLNPNLHSELAAVCHRMIAQRKEDRYSTCSEVIAALKQIDLDEPAESDVIFEDVDDEEPVFWEVATSEKPKPRKGGSTARITPPPIPLKSSPSARSNGQNPTRQRKRRGAASYSREVIGAAGICMVIATSAVTYWLLSRQPAQTPLVTAAASSPEPDRPAAATSSGDSPELASTTGDPLPQPDPSADTTTLGDAGLPGREVDANAEDADMVVAAATSSLPDSSSDTSPNDPEAEKPSESDQSAEPDNKPESVGASASSGGSDEVSRLIATAISMVQSDRRTDAITPLKRASNLSPTNPRPDFYLGMLYLGSGSPDPIKMLEKIGAAEMHFNKAFNRSAEGSVERGAIANNLAIIELKLKKYSAARNYFTVAFNKSTNPKAVNHNIGRLLSQLKVFDLKSDDLKKIQALGAPTSDFQPHSGWMFLPLDELSETRDQCLAFIPRHTLEDISCVNCNGTAKLKCIPCSGKGKRGVMTASGEKRDIGFGMTASSTSIGTTNVACPNCQGTGRIDCTGCTDGRDPTLHR